MTVRPIENKVLMVDQLPTPPNTVARTTDRADTNEWAPQQHTVVIPSAATARHLAQSDQNDHAIPFDLCSLRTEVDSRLERPATGGTPPAPLPPDVSGYAVFDLSGCPPPRMLSAVQVRLGFECTSSLQAAVTLNEWMTLQCATAGHSCEAECPVWQESNVKTAPTERQGHVTSCASMLHPPAPVMRVCSALGLSLQNEERCRSGIVLQTCYLTVECTEQ
jgi:hypothetical protein